jgi:hypothetical protein
MFCILSVAFAIPIMSDVNQDIITTTGIVFIMKNNLIRYLESGKKINGTTYIVPNNGYCRVYVIADIECNLTCRNSFKLLSFVPATVTHSKSFKTLEDAIIWQSNEITKLGFLISHSDVDILKGGNDYASRALNDALETEALKAKIALANAINTNIPYIGSFDEAIIGFVREYRHHEHKDIGCYDIKQSNRKYKKLI